MTPPIPASAFDPPALVDVAESRQREQAIDALLVHRGLDGGSR